MSKDYGYPSFELICKASSGDEMAVKEILKFYDGYISKLCLRPFYHFQSGKTDASIIYIYKRHKTSKSLLWQFHFQQTLDILLLM